MKRIFLSLLMVICTMGIHAQTAKQVLDKTSSVIGSKSGATASFSISGSKYGKASGTIAIKGNKFNARTPQAIVWYDGKTQWSYMKNTNEVNISKPTQAQQMSMNPYTFINIYKTGYNMTLDKRGTNYVAHLTAQNKQRSIQELYITINKATYIPSTIKMKQGGSWTTINVSNFKRKSLPNSTFTFNSKDFPTVEIIDLR